MKYRVIDSCPAPSKLVPVLELVKSKVGVPVLFNSIYRGEDAADLLHRLHKHTQAELYQMYLNGTGAPANPPGRSTHELRSDGVAYSGPVGRKLRWWQVGMDVNDAYVPAAKSAFANLPRKKLSRGYIVVSVPAVQPYPSGSEYHHLNLSKSPLIKLPPLKKGSRGKRVQSLTSKLAVLHRPHSSHTYLHWSDRGKVFNRKVQLAVEDFQRDNHLKPDGIVGPHTAAQIKVRWKYHKEHAR